jgi:hypothetical protein
MTARPGCTNFSPKDAVTVPEASALALRDYRSGNVI